MLNITFNKTKPSQRQYEYSIVGNAQVDVVRFVLQSNICSEYGLIDLGNFSAYVKVQSAGGEYIDKIATTSTYDSEKETLTIDFSLLKKTTQFKNISLQLQFETDDGQVVAQTEIVCLSLKSSIKADEEIPDLFPSVLSQMEHELADHEERIEELEQGGTGGGNVDDVKVNGKSVVENKVANIDLTPYATKEELNGKQDVLTFDNEPTENSSNPVKSGGVYNACEKIRQVAEGKCKSIVISYLTQAPTNDVQAQWLKKPNGTHFNDLQDFEDYVKEDDVAGECVNGLFNSQENGIDVGGSENYIITYDGIVYKYNYRSEESAEEQYGLKTGDIVLVIETDVPDRWFDYDSDIFHILETSKIDLTDYYTKQQTDIELAKKQATIDSSHKLASDLVDDTNQNNKFVSASEKQTWNAKANESIISDQYDSTKTYAVGDLVIYNNTLYKCNTAITQAEEWDSTHWTATKITSELGGGNFGFPIINAPSSTTLTDDEVSVISSGAVVLSSFLGYEKCVFFPIGNESFGEKAGMVIGVNGFTPELRAYRINNQKVISLYNTTDRRTRLQSISQINGISTQRISDLIDYAVAQGWIS